MGVQFVNAACETLPLERAPCFVLPEGLPSREAFTS
jgi:hypothetical protein